jgi:hypothetical protein
MTLEEWEKIDPPTKINGFGSKYWRNEEGKKHRDNDLPAVITAKGSMFWYQNDKFHRNRDLPAIVYSDGTKAYWKNGERYFP